MPFAEDVSPRTLIRSSRRRLLPMIVVLILPLTAAAAGAQDSSTVQGDRWLTSFSVGVPGAGVEAAPDYFTLGMQWTRLRPGRVGPDISIGVMPRALEYLTVLGGMRVGIALPVEVTPTVLLVPSSGVSVVGGAGAFGAHALAGLNAGLSTVLLTPSGAGVRTGVTWHRLGDVRQAIWLWEFGIVQRR